MSSINVTTCIQPIRNTLTHSSTQLAVLINVHKCVCYELFHFVHCLGLSRINLIFHCNYCIPTFGPPCIYIYIHSHTHTHIPRKSVRHLYSYSVLFLYPLASFLSVNCYRILKGCKLCACQRSIGTF